MFTRYHCFACLLFIISGTAAGQALKELANIDVEQADFYLLDVSDNNVKVASSIDAYIHRGDLYLAITPLFEGLRLNYSLIGNKLSVTFVNKTSAFDFTDKQDNKGQWFNDGSFIFIKASVLEQLFATKITMNTKTLKMNLSGHTGEFPYKTIKKQQKQRRLNNYIIDRSDTEQKTASGEIITIKDQYRLATVPTGYASVEYQINDRNERYQAVIQMESDLAYHSASITLNHNDKDDRVYSRVLLSRYPQFTGDKILGIWDTYSVGDLWLRQSSLTPGVSSRGLGINFSANLKDNYSENMTTSFSKTARPGWDADIYHNGVFMETRVVPPDGLMEFNNIEVYYGANEFKIVLYGPFGEQETLFEQVSVRSNSLGQGDLSYGLSLKENESSLLDINLSEFDIDAIGGYINIGIIDNWQLGMGFDLTEIHNPNGGSESYRISNQITLPGWFFQNNIAFNSAKNINQATSLATSFFNNDSFTLNYNSNWKEELNKTKLDHSHINVNYNINFNSFNNNISYSYDDDTFSKSERLNYRLTAYNKYINATNSLSYLRKNDTNNLIFGSLNLTTRVNNDLRFIANIPYTINREENIDPEQISATAAYTYRTETAYHSFTASNRSFFKENLWSVGYNVLINQPTHHFTLRTQYSSLDKWSVTAGIAIHFGYDYFNNEMVFSSQTLSGGGSLDVHTYLDRRLNGIPDVLDYNLPGVTFTGGRNWENVATNQDGQARLFGANKQVTALTANWTSGGATLNNDYLIYSHPGSLQRVNLPFYLTTELELFVVFSNDGQALTLANVPLTASNLATGDEYSIETDFDGYASFVDLLPGTYRVYVDKKYLRDKGLQADIGGFEFNSPLRGGFVVLPNIELSRSESGDIGANELLKVILDESNYAPLLDTDNDKLIHLPPKGGMKAPYSSDALHLAKFKEIKMQSTAQERRELRRKLAEAAENAQQFQPGLTKTSSQTEVSASLTSPPQTEQIFSTEITSRKDLNEQTPVALVTPLTSDSFTDVQDLPVGAPDTKMDLSSGYVVQYAAYNNLASATTRAQNFSDITQLHIVRKVVKGESIYCLISQVFQDKTSTREFLKTVNKDGFIVDETQYLEPIWSK